MATPANHDQGMPWEGYLIAAMGFGMAGVSVAINARYGQRMSVDDDGRLLNAALLIFISLGPSALSFYGAKLSARGQRRKARVSFALALVLISYSVWNANDFLTDQMLGKVRVVERKLESNKDISEQSNAEIIRSRRRTEDELWKQLKAEKNPAEKQRIEEKIEQLASKPVALSAAPVDSSAIDNRSSWLSRKTGIDRDLLQAIAPTGGAILMAAVELFFPWLGAGKAPAPAPNEGGLWGRWRRRHDGKLSANSRQFTKAEARDYVIAMVARGEGFQSNKEAAEVWGVSEPLASKWLASFRSEGILRREQRGRTKAVVAPRHANGNGMATTVGTA